MIETPSLHMRSYAYFLKNTEGLEIGGPSPNFFPLGVYSFPKKLDNVNFNEHTLWGHQTGQSDYWFHGKTSPGKNYICDGVDLPIIKNKSYDFLFASHVLEHMVNPLKALGNWNRVLKDQGILILVLPWKHTTFDRYRPISEFSQLENHYNSNRGEGDVMDLLPSILETYDFSMDPGAGGRENFIERCKHQFDNRALHVHVFDFSLIEKCCNFSGFSVIDKQLVVDCHQIVLAKKVKSFN